MPRLRARIQLNRYEAPPPRKREGDSKAHTRWIKSLPCLICGRKSDDPHHLKRGVDNMPKGMSRKHPDRWAIPVCRKHHNHLEAGNDEERLAELGHDGRATAARLWAISGDTEQAERIIRKAIEFARLKVGHAFI